MQDAERDIQRLVDASRGGEADAAKTADERLKDLAAQLDRAEDGLEWPRLEGEARRQLQHTREAVEASNDYKLRSQLQSLEAELNAALRARDKETIEARIGDANDLWFSANQRDPRFWGAVFHWLKSEPLSLFRDQMTARRLLEQGETAFARGDATALRRICDDLLGLLPEEARQKGQASFGSGIV